ncbi:MAG: hydroxylamine reductase [Chloroflexi bacterium]|nr:hydroxylamine reductase [Chloroflexota bacterium]
MDMFCNQCQEAARNVGCTRRGVCGKTATVSNEQDALIYLLRGLSECAIRAREAGVADPEADLFVAEGLFATITNANFDEDRMVELARRAIALRDNLRRRWLAAVPGAREEDLSPAARWIPEPLDALNLAAKGIAMQIVGRGEHSTVNEDLRSLRELLLYGLKGMAAYTDHAYVLGAHNDAILAFLQEGLVAMANDALGADDLVALVMRCGEMGVQAMALLDAANTGAYGHPEPTQTNIGVREGPAILVSGHDLRDLEELLEQTAGTGVNVYTHGEMLPATAYPAFKQYDHLVGNYGGSWWKQDKEFEAFGGAILMTTNCITAPKESYKERIFTTGLAGWPGVRHVPNRRDGQPKDFGPVIEAAKAAGSPRALESGTIPTGFAHQTVLGVADQVIAAVESGAIKRFVVMAGCDGRHTSREYYTQVAESLPEDHVILTAGCAKYRYNKLNLGEIGGIPRVLDAGQCNDSYSLVVIAQALAEALGVEDINDLPISYDIAWYEQKAVIVLLALLSLGVKHIRLGPTLPAFLSPGVAKVLVEMFDIMPIGEVAEDVAAIAAGR